MCGIAGLIKKNQLINHEEIKRMLDSIYHRGPDDEGVYVRGNLGLGHRRLSIIDLSEGHQPMISIDGDVVIVFNGEIYNYVELRAELIDDGYSFRTHSDTEVLLNAYLKWGKKCLNKLRGMFAFAIADLNEKEVWVARDWIGIKPIFFYCGSDMFAFASEIQALKKCCKEKMDIDIQALDQYLRFQYIPAPRTIYKNMFKLLPGHYITVSFEGKCSEQVRYHQIFFDATKDLEKEQAIAELSDVLFESVNKHLVSDVDFGAFLSGGIDSSLVVDYMSQILDVPVKTFSIAFKNDIYDESEYAKYVAKKTNSEHICKVIDDDAIKILPELVKHYGEPYGDSSAVPTYYVSQLASEYVKMVLTGDGADELFAGYPRYGAFYCEYKKYRNSTRGFIDRVTRKEVNKGLDIWISNVNYMNNDLRQSLWKKDYCDCLDDKVQVFDKSYEEAKQFTEINTAQYIDLNTYLPYDCLTKVDIASMMNGLEARTPFIDREVIDFAMRLPDRFNWEIDDKNNYQGKVLLKKILEKKYSKDFIYRRKRGFSMPLQRWFEEKGNYAYEMKKSLLSEESKIRNYFSNEGIKQVLEGNHTGSVWLLIFLEEWLQQNI